MRLVGVRRRVGGGVLSKEEGYRGDNKGEDVDMVRVGGTEEAKVNLVGWLELLEGEEQEGGCGSHLLALSILCW